MSKIIFTLLAATLGYIALKAYNLFNSINVQFTSISITNLFQGAKLFATFTIYNPTSFNVTISSIKGALYYDGKFLADIATIQPIVITNNNATVTDLQIDPTILSVINFVSQYITGLKPQFSFIGHIYILGIPFSVNQIIPN